MIVFGMFFLFSSTGIVIYKSHCLCTGNEEVSLFLIPETCEDSFHDEHLHEADENEAETDVHECHECSSHTDNCGCSAPEIRYFKLVNHINEEEIQFINVRHVIVFVAEMIMISQIDGQAINPYIREF